MKMNNMKKSKINLKIHIKPTTLKVWMMKLMIENTLIKLNSRNPNDHIFLWNLLFINLIFTLFIFIYIIAINKLISIKLYIYYIICHLLWLVSQQNIRVNIE